MEYNKNLKKKKKIQSKSKSKKVPSPLFIRIIINNFQLFNRSSLRIFVDTACKLYEMETCNICNDNHLIEFATFLSYVK